MSGDLGANPRKAKKVAGAVSKLADAQGGPSTAAGIGYQGLVQVYELLSLFKSTRNDPTSAAALRCEHRQTFTDKTQYGWDLGVGGVAHDPVKVVEVKLSPIKDEVLDVLVRARQLVEGELTAEPFDGLVELVAGSLSGPFKALTLLLRHHGETADDQALLELVALTDNAVEVEMLEALGDTPGTVLGHVRATFHSQYGIEEQLRFMTAFMAQAGRGDDLFNRLAKEVLDASKARREVRIVPFAADLEADGLLQPQSAVEITGDQQLVSILAALQECVVPLPARYLAAASGLTEEALAEMLADQVAAGLVAQGKGGYLRLATMVLPAGEGEAIIRGVLRELSVHASTAKDALAGQVPNAYALAAVLDQAGRDLERARVVGRAFVDFDKACKAHGDLWITEDLAAMSIRAIDVMLGSNLSDKERLDWEMAKAQTWICGHAWVWQRVGLLSRAVELMERARVMVDINGDAENYAFIRKCGGRLRRMLAEEDPDPEAAASLIAESADLLAQAKVDFDALFEKNPRFYEDRGECLSLLARTLAASEDRSQCADLIEQATALLAVRPGSKAYADLVVLKAELALPDDPDDPDDPDWRTVAQENLSALDDLLVLHEHEVTDAGERTSELAARVRVARGDIFAALGMAAEARGEYEIATAAYVGFHHDHARLAAEWRLMSVAEVSLPRGLLEAFARSHVPEGVRVFAAKHLAETLVEHGRDLATVHVDDLEFWDAAVHEGERRHAALYRTWEEGRDSA